MEETQLEFLENKLEQASRLLWLNMGANQNHEGVIQAQQAAALSVIAILQLIQREETPR